MPPIRAVLFDYGHTIIDFTAAQENLLACYQEVRLLLTAEALRELPEAPHLIEHLSRRVLREIQESYEQGELQELDIVTLFDTALRAMEVELPRDFARRIAEMEHRALFSGQTASSDNLETLRTLKERGLKLGLVSNASLLPDLMHQDIERLGIAQYMDAAVFSSEVGVRKPHPAIYQTVLDRLQVTPAEAIFVGDRLHDDIGGAKRLGMSGVLTREFRAEDVNGSDVQPDYVVNHLPEVVSYVLSRHVGNEQGDQHGQDQDDDDGDENA